MSESSDTTKLKGWEFPLAAILAWLVPGAGHFYLGLRKRAVLLFIAIELTFFIGLYIGTVRIVDPSQSMFWFLAQILTGLNTIIAYLFSTTLPDLYPDSPVTVIYDWTYYMAVLYTGVAGLLNLLAVFDTIIRAGRANIEQATSPAD